MGQKEYIFLALVVAFGVWVLGATQKSPPDWPPSDDGSRSTGFNRLVAMSEPVGPQKKAQNPAAVIIEPVRVVEPRVVGPTAHERAAARHAAERVRQAKQAAKESEWGEWVGNSPSELANQRQAQLDFTDWYRVEWSPENMARAGALRDAAWKAYRLANPTGQQPDGTFIFEPIDYERDGGAYATQYVRDQLKR